MSIAPATPCSARSVALKILPPDLVNDAGRLSRFIQEARAASALNHPHVITIHEIREAMPMRDGVPIPGLPSLHYLAMELVTGDTLRALIEDAPAGPEARARSAGPGCRSAVGGACRRRRAPRPQAREHHGRQQRLREGAGLRTGQAATGPDQPTTPRRRPSRRRRPAHRACCSGPSATCRRSRWKGVRPIIAPTCFRSGACCTKPSPAPARLPDPRPSKRCIGSPTSIPLAVVRGLTSAPPELRRIVGKCLARGSRRTLPVVEGNGDRSARAAPATRIGRRRQRRAARSGPPACVARRRGSPPRPWPSPPAWRRGSGSRAGRRRTVAPAGSQDRTNHRERIPHARALSPDGKYLAYTDNPGGRQSLWVRQVDGVESRSSSWRRGRSATGAVAFARDGTSIFYAVKGRDDPGGSIYQIPFLGGPSRKIVAHVDSPPALSPDGRQLAYLRADYPEPGASAVMIAGADGADPRALAVKRPPEFFAPGNFVSASWSPDGSRLVTPLRNSQTRTARLVTIGLSGDEAAFGETFTTSDRRTGCRTAWRSSREASADWRRAAAARSGCSRIRKALHAG